MNLGVIMKQFAKRFFNISLLFIIAFSGAQAQTILEEIVVTATKRGEMSVHDVAGGIQAIGGIRSKTLTSTA